MNAKAKTTETRVPEKHVGFVLLLGSEVLRADLERRLGRKSCIFLDARSTENALRILSGVKFDAAVIASDVDGANGLVDYLRVHPSHREMHIFVVDSTGDGQAAELAGLLRGCLG